MTNERRIAWIDTETTGLDPEEDYLLEIAVVITDFDLNEIASFESVIGWFSAEHVKSRANDYVKEMHEKTGLWDRVEAASQVSHTSFTVDDNLVQFLIDNYAVNSIIAGNSITLDRNFMRADLPLSYDQLHYRSIDVTSIAELAREWYGIEYKKELKHSALDDIRESIEELKFLRANAFKSPEQLEEEVTLKVLKNMGL